MERRRGMRGSRAGALFAVAGASILLVACAVCWMVFQIGRRGAQPMNRIELAVAYSPEKQELFDELVERFLRGRPATTSGKPIRISLVQASPEEMIAGALDGTYDVISPDSSVWLAGLEEAWTEKNVSENAIVGETSRFAISPVVIAAWEDVAKSLGYPERAVGWADVLSLARSNPEFKWSHASTTSASGLLATLATFYAGAGKTRGLTVEDATAESTLAYVSALEKTVRYYGEGELAVMQQVREKGRGYLDAFVIQEQLLIRFNRESKGKLIAIYPAEGTMWADHPLVFLERPETTADERLAFRQFRDFLLSPDSQMFVLQSGYRPADLTIPLDSTISPINVANGADAAQPKTTLQIPSPNVVDVVRDAWWYTKRQTNVYLVADVSGSMHGEKLDQAREAFLAFVDFMRGQQDRTGLIAFSTGIEEDVPLAELSTNRQRLSDVISGLEAGGDTALLDAVDLAYTRLQTLQDHERINAIVVMTDGQENNSRIRLRDLEAKMQRGNRDGVQVVVFCVAYGDDADLNVLERIASASGGQVRTGNPETIQELYKLLSTYF